MLAAEHVVLDKGTGLVHTAMAFGEEDFVLCERHNIPLVNPVRADGTYDERITGYEGVFVADAIPRIVEELEAAGKLFRAEPYVHSYPHCWRCDSKLLYYAKESWYIATRDQRHAMLAQNQRIDWRPEHVRDGRFGNWLQGNVDWALSRDRYWGTPLPIWVCEHDDCDARHCIGSLAELRDAAGELPQDLHRPYIDDVTWACTVEGCGGTMRRVRGDDRHLVRLGLHAVRAVPLPVRGAARGGGTVPADVHMRGDRPDARLVLHLARVLDAAVRRHPLQARGLRRPRAGREGPEDVEEPRQRGRPVGRCSSATAPTPSAGTTSPRSSHGPATASPRTRSRRAMRELLLPLWSDLRLLRALREHRALRRESRGRARRRSRERPALDRWALSRLQQVILEMRERIDAFDATTAVRLAAEWVEDLSNWYIRLSRPPLLERRRRQRLRRCASAS